jgi:hypothetical protein
VRLDELVADRPVPRVAVDLEQIVDRGELGAGA